MAMTSVGVRSWRRIAAPIAGGLLAVSLGGCGSDGGSSASERPKATAATTTSTTVPEALWIGQGQVWLKDNAAELKAISASAKSLGDAAKSGDGTKTKAAVNQFIVDVGDADGTLPTNAFGQDLHAVFVRYVTALSEIRKGIVDNDEKAFSAGSKALGVAVGDFGVITRRLAETP